MSSDAEGEKNIKIEIQKTLVSIYNLTTNINGELKVIKDYTKKNGELRTAVLKANKTLTAVARDANVDVNRILGREGEDDRNEVGESQPDFTNSVSSDELRRKIMSLLYNM